MSIEDVVLVSTVREDTRSHALQVDSAEIPLRVEAEQHGALSLEIPAHLVFHREPVWLYQRPGGHYESLDVPSFKSAHDSPVLSLRTGIMRCSMVKHRRLWT